MISAIVLTKNEEKKIEVCLKNLRWCDEILVIDDYSQDKTAEIAKKIGARIFRRRLNGDFASQRNFGLRKAKGDWVLFIDADEIVSIKLRREILKNIDFTRDDRPLQSQGTKGFRLKRKDKFLGKWLRFGETSKVKLLRLARREKGKWQRAIHEVWQIKGKLGELKHPIIHNREISIDDFLKRINYYSSLRAKELYQKKVRTNAFFISAYPLGKFLQNYFLKLGFLDGKEGFIMAVMMSIHSFLVRSKLYLLWKNKGKEEFEIPSLKDLYKKHG